MSNLQLPIMSHRNLSTMRVGRTGKIAYATHIDRLTQDNGGAVVTVYHHGNAIARLTPDHVEVSNAGWESVTTANRLTAILRDNGINVAVGITKGNMVFRSWDSDGKQHESPVPWHKWVTFNR